MTLTIRTNNSTTSNILVKDLGFYIPKAGANLVLTNLEDINKAQESLDLISYLTDDAYGVDSSTLILVSNGTDVSQDSAEAYLNRADTVPSNSWFGGWA